MSLPSQIGSPSAALKDALLNNNRPLQLAVRPLLVQILRCYANLPSIEASAPMASSGACPSIEKLEPRGTV